jgi:alkylhydroperoxidase family enzyme
MPAFFNPPVKIPLVLRIGIWFAERLTGKTMLPARLLAWYPRAALSSGVLEALVTHKDRQVDERLLKLVRMQASFAVACPFCVDMNSVGYEQTGISDAERACLQEQADPESVSTFSRREALAIRYTRQISRTPLEFPSNLIENLRAHFDERELVILATTAAQVNYWARLIQAMGVPPAGFMENCDQKEKNAT